MCGSNGGRRTAPAQPQSVMRLSKVTYRGPMNASGPPHLGSCVLPPAPLTPFRMTLNWNSTQRHRKDDIGRNEGHGEGGRGGLCPRIPEPLRDTWLSPERRMYFQSVPKERKAGDGLLIHCKHQLNSLGRWCIAQLSTEASPSGKEEAWLDNLL